MRCPNCGYENEMDSQFCGNCGAPLPPPEKKKSKAPLIIVIAVLVAVLLAGAIGFVAYTRISEKKEEELRQEQLEAEREQEEQEEQEEKERAGAGREGTGRSKKSPGGEGSEGKLDGLPDFSAGDAGGQLQADCKQRIRHFRDRSGGA